MDRGKMPKISSNNGMTVDVIPEGLILTELENNLIAKNIIFQKLTRNQNLDGVEHMTDLSTSR